jgi:serine/threonine-protein kinase HipA
MMPQLEMKIPNSQTFEKLIAASFLNETTKRNYRQAYQTRLRQLMKGGEHFYSFSTQS